MEAVNHYDILFREKFNEVYQKNLINQKFQDQNFMEDGQEIDELARQDVNAEAGGLLGSGRISKMGVMIKNRRDISMY